MDVDEIITCVDCGGRAHLLSRPPEWGWQPGDLLVYRCEDCRDRWDVIVPDDAGNDPDDDPAGDPAGDPPNPRQ